MRLPALPVLGLSVLLAACAANPWNVADIPPGSTKADVLARAGQPARTYPRPEGGERLLYTMQPMGRYVFVADLDASGRVVDSGQMLTEANLQKIQPGKWTTKDVEYDFGPPATIDRVASWNGPVWTYRWRATDTDMFYWIYFTPEGVVARAHPGMEMINAPNDRASR
ncbi:hypothetical protein HHL11_03260 [Ramlibacter sp. G-1-2-2]|uniref:Lipoprotein transmembrane n=1 Tax=Ramlibacter agri TaxID=2728837 RepID=A0A848GVW3_9BURK|nr:hypothetical protein [Ramlibacter agri]